MKNNQYIICFLLLLITCCGSVYGQQDRNQGLVTSSLKGLEYSIKAGFNIGGTAPLPLPAEIREIQSYNPTVALAIEGNITKYFDKKWGITTGLRLETKGMKTDANVKNYHMEMVANDGGEMKGYWTGNVETKVRNTYLTIPVLANYRISSRWDVKAGPYVSYMTDGEFSGLAYEGYIRNTDPTGEKVELKGDATASYDFSGDLKKFQWGAQVGTSWKAFSHLSVYADITWGFNSIFKKEFTAVSFEMYPIYANLGFAYLF